MTDSTDPPPKAVDTATANVGRMYDFYLEGKDNFAVDWETAEQVLKVCPEIRAMDQQNREFLGRAVRYLAAQGFRQFIDLGTGLPTRGHVHEVLDVLQLDDCRVVYVDDDPVVQAHAAALISGPNTVLLETDLRRPGEILGHPRAQKIIDPEQPVALLAFAVLHFVSDADDPAALVGEYIKNLPAGSCLAYTHGTDEYDPEGVAALKTVYENANHPAHPRSVVAIQELATANGLVIHAPGIVKVTDWNPGGEMMATIKDPAALMSLVGGVAQKLPTGVSGHRR